VLVSSRIFQAKTVSLYGGRLFIAGTGYDGVDVERTFYEDATRYGRKNALLGYAPPMVTATVTRLNARNGTLTVASMSNDFYVKDLYWTGGTLIGRVNLRVQRFGRINGTTTKRLRNGFQLWNYAKRLDWVDCDVILSEGSAVRNEGTMWITGRKPMKVTYDAQQTDWYPGRSWDEGWYPNAVCGDACTATPVFENTASGEIRMLANTTYYVNVTFLQRGTLITQGSSRFEIGGGGSGNGTFNIGANSTIRLSQGTFYFRYASTTNRGFLEVTDGYHKAPWRILPKVRLKAGTLQFNSPNVRFISSVFVYGGMIKFSRMKQNVTIVGNLTMVNGAITFLDQVNLYRDHRIADDRASLTVPHMKWYGGVLDGNARVFATKTLDMDNDHKYLQGGLILVYYGDAYWGTGDIVTKEASTLLHRGTLSMKNALNFTASLTQSNTFNGCCPYKSTELLQWDE